MFNTTCIENVSNSDIRVMLLSQPLPQFIISIQVQQTDVADMDVATAIRNKLKTTPGVSYASIAEQAISCDRKDLAVKVKSVCSYASYLILCKALAIRFLCSEINSVV